MGAEALVEKLVGYLEEAEHGIEIAKLMKACDASLIGAEIMTSLGTGLRRGELLALRWGDVDLQGRQLTDRRAIERSDRRSR